MHAYYGLQHATNVGVYRELNEFLHTLLHYIYMFHVWEI